MNHNLPAPDELEQLFAAARLQQVDTSAAEFAFETRLLAHLQERKRSLFSYGTMAWRLIPVFSCVVLILAFGYYRTAQESDQAEQLAQDQPQEQISVLEITD